MLKRLWGGGRKREECNPTYQERMDQFWSWYSERAGVFYQAIEDENFDPFAPEVSAKMDEFLPGLAWVFGPGEGGVGHSFTISPEGNPYKALLATHVVKAAPELEGWTFHDSRQASPGFKEMKMRIVGKEIMAEQIWVSATIDEEREEIDIVCWNPLFEDLPEADRGQITFLWLDEALGEFQVTNRIGSVDINASALESSMPLSEFPDFVAEVEKERGWKRRTPGEYYVGYEFREREDFMPEFLRSDIFTGTSLLWQLSRDHYREEGKFDHPLPKLGVDFLFVAIPRAEFTKGKVVDERADLEDRIQEAFSTPPSGVCLGGASGRTHIYIDLVGLDGERSISAIKEALASHPLGQQAKLYYFDKGRGSQPL